jgi:hypothetical protein
LEVVASDDGVRSKKREPRSLEVVLFAVLVFDGDKNNVDGVYAPAQVAVVIPFRGWGLDRVDTADDEQPNIGVLLQLWLLIASKSCSDGGVVASFCFFLFLELGGRRMCIFRDEADFLMGEECSFGSG